MRFLITLAGLGVVSCSRSDSVADRPVDSPAPVAASRADSLPVLAPPSLERLRAMASGWTFPVAEDELPCQSTDATPRGERFRCVVASGDTVVLSLVTRDEGAVGRVVEALLVLDAAGRTVDSVPTGAEEPPPAGSTFLATQDLDFDGIRELKILRWWGVTGNRGWVFLHVDTATHRLRVDSALTTLGNPQPLAANDGRCVRVASKGGHAGMIRNVSVHCWDGGRLPELFREEQDWDGKASVYVRRSFARVGGADTLSLVETVRFPAPR